MISAVVLAKNEQDNLERCLRSLGWCSEIIVIDDYSRDSTAEIAQKFKAKVFKRELKGSFADQRNFGLKKSQGEWVFFVDADEEVSPALSEEIKKMTTDGEKIGFYLRRQDFFLNQQLKHGETARVRLLRLARRDAGQWVREVDERWELGDLGELGELKELLIHYSHPTLKEFFENVNDRSTLNAQVFYSQRKRVTLVEWLKPVGKFLVNYFCYLGFLDGISGFIFAVGMSFHSFLVRGKLYLLWRRQGGWQE